jgi:hypothetical protein
LASLIWSGAKLTSRSLTATFVSASSFKLPSAGFVEPLASYETAAYAVMCFWSVQLETCGW